MAAFLLKYGTKFLIFCELVRVLCYQVKKSRKESNARQTEAITEVLPSQPSVFIHFIFWSHL